MQEIQSIKNYTEKLKIFASFYLYIEYCIMMIKYLTLELSIKNRDKQLCKPLLRLFNNTKAQDEIITSLSKFLAEKKNKKLDSFDAYLYSVVSDLVKEENTVVSNEVLWDTVCSLPGTDDS